MLEEIEVAPGIFQSEEDYRANMDYDAMKDQQAEDKAYRAWERQQKNHILAMSDTQKKQTVWQRVFPKMEHGDEWMLSANVF
jgi:hypothetical protein